MHLIPSLIAVAASLPSLVLGQVLVRQLHMGARNAIIESLESAPPGPGTVNLKTYFFNQTKDHTGEDEGYFMQKYYTNDQFYKPGGPILFYIQGESPAEPAFITSTGVSIHSLAQNYSGYLVSLEHRYYSSDSMPVPDLSTPNLKWLTSRQSVADGVNFLNWFKANNGFPECTKILAFGGSYPGSLAAWYRTYHPELIFAAQASSAPVQAQVDFHEYSEAVRLGVADPQTHGSPQCIANWALAVFALDQGMEKTPEKTKLDFGLAPLNLTGDVTGMVSTILATGVQYGPTYSPFDNSNPASAPIIDTICNASFGFPEFTNPNATQSSLYNALARWFNLWLTTNGYTPNDESSISELSTYNLANRNDLSDPLSASKLWWWQTCNEFGFFQVAEQIHKPAYSRYNNVEYQKLACAIVFGDAFANPPVEETNRFWGGSTVSSTNLIWVNGKIDPRQGESGNPPRTPDAQPTFMHDGFHCFDMYSPRSRDTPTMRAVKSGVDQAWAKIMAQDTCPAIVAAKAA
ncbi:hypothetical protein HK101_000479 [Irineochytrium annulatum]|nr:hypothetical protein HK101_000479 [Irineochytrium annulatum]